MIGSYIADVSALNRIVCDAHYKLLPDVPIAGWDVALTTDGIYLLEANLSCNFFLGHFDRAQYFAFVDQVYVFVGPII